MSELIFTITAARFITQNRRFFMRNGERKSLMVDPVVKLDSRTFGFFHSFEKAEEDLKSNGDTIYESDNKYACIASLKEGTLNVYGDSNKTYYIWEGSWNDGGYVCQDKIPKELEEYFGKNVCNYMQPF